MGKAESLAEADCDQAAVNPPHTKGTNDDNDCDYI